jgi:hypothetical protein
MISCPWEKMNGFKNSSEFYRFIDWITNQTKEGIAEEVRVESPYLKGNTFREKWYRHKASNDTWRLVWPDPPFTGVFEPVTVGRGE